ncbi:MAG: cytochrome c biogenesis protein CcsA [Bacteroidetes bacterium]|nr:cytochrome c biogenesis protein CcsA [Bacteroidota bacterium]
MFGNVFIILALIAAIYSVVMYYQASNGNERALVFARYGYHTMAALIISACLFFLYIIVTHQFQYKYVFDYSNADLSTGLLLSTFYAGQEGSFLLWLVLAVVAGIVLQNYTSKKQGLEPAFMMIYSLVLVFLIAMVTPFFKSPFNFIWLEASYTNIKYFNQSFLNFPFLQNFIFTDSKSNQSYVQMGPDLFAALKSNGIAIGDFLIKGKGLNPLLQNFWMEVHPPILFLGFALSIVPFTFAVSALIKNKYDQWIKLALPWTIAASVILGLGLMIGGYWAYGVLGWGGFWGWDPVENASLIPWLISVALIHTMLIQKQTQISNKLGRLAKTNLVLAVLMFILVVYSTFLTRSGILSKASVHSFEDPGAAVYVFLILFILTFTFIGLGGVYYRRKSLTGLNNIKEKFLSRENGLLYGSLILVASALVVFVGTSAPILGESVETSFYNKMNLPLVIIMGLLISLSLFLRWRETDGNNFVKGLIPSLIISILLSVAASILLGINDFLFVFFFFSIIFTIIVNIQMLIRVFRNGFYFWGGHLAHIGFALFLFGVLASGTLSKSQQIDLPLGIKTKVLNFNLTFVGGRAISGSDKYAFDINVNDKNKSYTASPIMFISDFNNELMREPYILEGFTNDLYFSPISYVDKNENNPAKVEHISLKEQNNAAAVPSEILTVEISTKPFISFVWIGVFIMSIGFVIVVLRRNRENKILNL